MSGDIWTAIVCLCAAGLVAKVVHLWTRPHTSALGWICGALVALVAATLLQVDAVRAYVDGHTELDTSGTLSNCLTVLGLLCGQCVFLYLTHGEAEAKRRLRPRLWIGAATVLVMVVLLVTTPSDYADFLLRRDTSQQVPVVSAAAYVFVVYLVVVACGFIRSSWAYSLVAGRPSLRLGLWCLALASLIAVAYAVVRAAAMTGYLFGFEPEVLDGDLIGELFRTAIVNAVIGVLLPYVGASLGYDAFARWLRVNRSYRTLYPLWRQLDRAFPGTTLDRPALKRFALRRPDRALYRRVIEIWDGRLQLRPYLDPDVDGLVRAHPKAAGLSADELAATVEASLLADALRVRARVPGSTGDRLVPSPGAQLEDQSEVDWLTRVARTFVSSPVVREFASAPIPGRR